MPQRKIFYVDVGNLKPSEVGAFLQKVREHYQRERDLQLSRPIDISLYR